MQSQQEPLESLEELESFHILTELPSKSLSQKPHIKDILTKSKTNNNNNNSTSNNISNSTLNNINNNNININTTINKSNNIGSKRGRKIIGNLRINIEKNEKQNNLNNTPINRTPSSTSSSLSLPINSFGYSQILLDENSTNSITTSEPDVDYTKTSNSNLTGFQRFQQIVQTANQSSRRKFIPLTIDTNSPSNKQDILNRISPTKGSKRKLSPNEDDNVKNNQQDNSNISNNDNNSNNNNNSNNSKEEDIQESCKEIEEVKIFQKNQDKNLTSLPTTPTLVSLPGGIFSAVVQGASTTNFSTNRSIAIGSNTSTVTNTTSLDTNHNQNNSITINLDSSIPASTTIQRDKVTNSPTSKVIDLIDIETNQLLQTNSTVQRNVQFIISEPVNVILNNSLNENNTSSLQSLNNSQSNNSSNDNNSHNSNSNSTRLIESSIEVNNNLPLSIQTSNSTPNINNLELIRENIQTNTISTSLPTITNTTNATNTTTTIPQGITTRTITNRQINRDDIGYATDYVLPSLCFSLEERLTSLTTTECGSYALATFSSGNIRLFELMKSGNTDLEDRFGYVIGQISGAGKQYGLLTHIECSGIPFTIKNSYLTPPISINNSLSSFSSSSSTTTTTTTTTTTANNNNNTISPSHIFVGARSGSVKFLVIDTLSITRSKKKRGFLTMIDHQIHIIEKTDGRLRGFCSVIQSSYQSIQCIYDQNCEECKQNYDPLNDIGFKCKYHLLCGGGTGVFTIWEVILTSEPICKCCVKEDNEFQRHDIIYKYKDNWNVIYQGSVKAPSLLQGFFLTYPEIKLQNSNFNITSSPWTSSINLLSTEKYSSSLIPFLEILIQGSNDKDAKIIQLSTNISTIQTSDIEEHNPVVHGQIISAIENSDNGLDDSHSSFHEVPSFNNKNIQLKGIGNVHTTSKDGMIIFSGLEEFIIHRMIRLDSNIIESYEKIIFSIHDFMNFDQHVQKRSRHFRQIESIECTNDGQYALIRCSDGTVLLYSLINIFESGIEPIRTEVKFESSTLNFIPPKLPYGYLTLCYQILDQYSLKLSLSYVNNHPSLFDETEKNKWFEKYPNIKHPSSLLILTSWIPITTSSTSLSSNKLSKSGVLKVDRLCLLSSSTNFTTTSFEKFIPAFIPSIALVNIVGLNLQDKRLNNKVKKQELCLVCGSYEVNHWPDLLVSDKKLHKPNSNYEIISSKRNQSLKLKDISEDNTNRSIKRTNQSIKQNKNIMNKRKKQSLFGGEDDGDIDEIEAEVEVEGEENNLDKIEIVSKKGNYHQHHQHQHQSQESISEDEINLLRRELEMKEKECVTLMRKFDKRFESEMIARRKWKSEMSKLEEKLEEEQIKRIEMESNVIELKRYMNQMFEAAKPFLEFCQFNSSKFSNTIFPNIFTSSSSSSSTTTLDSSLNSNFLSQTQTQSINSLAFCVVCQSYTADTVILYCGHLCLCYSHANTMKSLKLLNTCPVCKQECHDVLRVVK